MHELKVLCSLDLGTFSRTQDLASLSNHIGIHDIETCHILDEPMISKDFEALTRPPNQEQNTPAIFCQRPSTFKRGCTGERRKHHKCLRSSAHRVENVERGVPEPDEESGVETEQVEGVESITDDLRKRPGKHHRREQGVGVNLRRCM